MSDEEFEPQQFRIKKNKCEIRENQLSNNRPKFSMPPRNDSCGSFSFFSDSQDIPLSPKSLTMPKRSMSVSEFQNSIPKEESIETKNLISYDVLEQAAIKLHHDPPKFVFESIEYIIHKKNHCYTTDLSKEIMIPISALLRADTNYNSLIIGPSNSIFQWLRTFFIESHSICPEGRIEQQKAIMSIKSGRTKVLFCIPSRVSTLNLSSFNSVFIIKSELCKSSFPSLISYSGLIICHRTPGYYVKYPFQITETQMINEIRCIPEVVFSPIISDSLEPILMNESDLSSILIFSPFKNMIEEVYKKVHKYADRYSDSHVSKNKATLSTTSILYTAQKFDICIFLGFPVSISSLLSFCYSCSRVIVLVSIPTGIRLQSLSHNNFADSSMISNLLRILFWNSSCFRKSGDYCFISESGLDISKDFLCDFISFLAETGYLEYIPFTYSNVSIKVLSMIDEMKTSLIMSYFLKGSSNAKGEYSIGIPNLCNSLCISPIDVEFELNKYSDLRAIDLKFFGEVITVKLKKCLNDDEFIDLLNFASSHFATLEEINHKEFDIVYSIIKDPESISSYISEPEIFQPKEIFPYTPINTEIIRKLLTTHSHEEWTPRAIARILHSIPSPLFPFDEWSRSSMWGSQQLTNFADVMKYCQSVSCNPTKIKSIVGIIS